MTEVSERYDRLADAFAGKIDAVPDDRWDAPTPCPDWTVRDLVGHVVTTQGMILGLVGRDLGDVPSATDDPAAAWAAARAVVWRDLEDPSVANTEFEGGLMGKMTFETAVDRFLNFDLVVHGWDLARGAGLDERIDPGELAHASNTSEGFGDAMRGPKAFGPELELPPNADEQQRFLAFVGRS
jgi:uncharacterized protein (TIGR03086 family)